jgi:hypothetical protein
LITALVVEARQLVKTVDQPSPAPGDANMLDPNRDGCREQSEKAQGQEFGSSSSFAMT